MSWNSGTFTLDGGSDRFEQEFINNDNVNYQSMDAQFSDVASGINLCFPADGSKVATGNWNMGGFELLNVDVITNLSAVTSDLCTFSNDVDIAGILEVDDNVAFNSDLYLAGLAELFGGVAISGLVELAGDLNMPGQNIEVDTINGIDAPSTGTYTPTFASTGGTFTYTSQQGNYTLIGDLVICTVNISANLTGTHTGELRIELPFACNATTAGSASVGYYEGLSNGTGFRGILFPLATSVGIYRDTTGLSYAEQMPMSDCESSINLTLTITYTKS
jgi:hypothetical protein